MFTIVESRMTISWAMATMTRISQRWSFAGGDWTWAGGAVMETHLCWTGGRLPVRITGDEWRHRVVQGVQQTGHRGSVSWLKRTKDLLHQALPRGACDGERFLPLAGEPHEQGPAVRRIRLPDHQAITLQRVNQLGDRPRR